MTVDKSLVSALLVLAVFGFWGVGPASGGVRAADGNVDGSFSFAVPTPSVTTAPVAEGFDEILIEGFASAERRAGAPAIPTQTFRVAIPFGVEPRLEVRRGELRWLPGVRPRPVGRRVSDLSPGAAERLRDTDDPALRAEILRPSVRELLRPDPELYGAAEPWPREPARLGATGVLRDQRYVEVHVAPVRWYPDRGLAVESGLEVTVRFDGQPSLGARPAAADPVYEGVYADALVNYEQGRRFRRPAADATSAAATARVAAGTDARAWIEVTADGPVRLTAQSLVATGLLASDPRTWRLSVAGEPVPLHIVDDLDPVLEPGEYVEFWGQAWTMEPKTRLDVDMGDPYDNIYALTDVTDVSPYLLEATAETQAETPELDGTPAFSGTPPTAFDATVVAEVDDGWRPLLGEDPWGWLPTLGAATTIASRQETIALPGLAGSTLPLDVRVVLHGLSQTAALDPDHETRVTLKNGANQILAQSQQSFDGRAVDQHDVAWTWPGSGAQVGSPLRVQIESLVVGSQTRNDVILDRIEIDYRRTFAAVGGRLDFAWPDGPATEFVVDGLADTAPLIYEVTPTAGRMTAEPRLVTGAAVVDADSIRFRIDDDPAVTDGTLRRFAVVEPALAVEPTVDDVEVDVVSDLRQAGQVADLIVIGHPELIDDQPGSPLDDLLAWRATPAGGDLVSKVVLIGDVEDEFNAGFHGPDGVREFLRFVMSDEPGEGWVGSQGRPRPSYVMLVGDASFDVKAGPAQGEFVPTELMLQDEPELAYYASDNEMAQVVGDDETPDLVVSRVPARTLFEAELIFNKTLDYETAPVAGTWREHVTFVADRGKKDNSGDINAGESFDFEFTNSLAADRMSVPPYSATLLRYYSDYCNDLTDVCDDDGMRQDVLDEVNGLGPAADGAAIVQYVGHGNFVVWSDDAFFDERPNPPDSASLVNAQRLSWLVAHNCLTGGFHITPAGTMGENWLKRVGGGAVGVFSPTGLSFNSVGRPVGNRMYDAMFGNRQERAVGVIAYGALLDTCVGGPIESCQNYALQGDPALRVTLRGVAPARNPQAVGGDAEVTLTWDPSETAGTIVYDVYRVRNLQLGQYTLVGSTGATMLVDDGVQNAIRYYYYVVARDQDGFVSRWSNFNGDCDTFGPDCLTALPLNPNPPDDPTGLTVEDPATGDALWVRWDAPGETDIAYHTVFVGTAQGVYDQSFQGGAAPAFLVTGLDLGQDYVFAVKATNTSGLTSGFSGEAGGRPTLDRGLRAPAFVRDLRVSRSGPDLLLQWGEVTDDLYGSPKAASNPVATYEILRGESPGYGNAGLVVIDTCAAPCTSYLDTGAYDAPAAYRYRVRAVDADGNAGALGGEPPRPTDLRLGRSGTVPGDLVLEWDPVALATDDGPVAAPVTYEVYAADTPVGRAAIRDGLVSPLAVVGTTSFELTPAPGNRYYSVIAVDARGNRSPF